MIRITIPETLPTPNVMLRLHWGKRQRIQRRVAQLIWAAITAAKSRPAEPIKRCRIRIKRYSGSQPDTDAMNGTAKFILDSLQPPSKRHPYGLGVIADDTAACVVSLDVEHVGKRIGRTDIEIEAVE